MTYLYVKRGVDIILSIILLIVLFPLFIIIALFIKISSVKPIIFHQERVGFLGKTFTLYKFTTMSGPGLLWTSDPDSRVTKLGKILRTTHLDELPQLINILKNDMSFVGPRPERVELVEKYRQLPNYDKRHFVKPGLSGLAQLHYKPSTSIEEAEEKLKYDLLYIEKRSVSFDIIILIKTALYSITGQI